MAGMPGMSDAAASSGAAAGSRPTFSHSFASVQMGEVGLLNVGHVAGTMSH